MRVCPTCHAQYDDTVQFCPNDAAKLLIVGTDEDKMVGAIIGGKYRVDRKIGEGGMGKIYEARHVTLGKRFAIKTLHPDYTRNREALERFHREATTTANLEHPNILGMADMDQMDDGTAYIVMEFLDGRELRDVLNEQGVLPIPRAVHIFSQLCRALYAAHQQGIVHRDLKPENVFLVCREDDPDFVKVLDFGISKIRAAGSKLTQTGMVIGTPQYMSPEQVRSDPGLDNRSDIYTIGVMLYEALVGRLPVEAENPTGVLVKILTEEPPPPRAVNPNLSPELEAVILKAMAKEKNQRFATCRELMEAFQRAAGMTDATGVMGPVGVSAGVGRMGPAFPPTQVASGVAPAMQMPSQAGGGGVPAARTPGGFPGAQPAFQSPGGVPGAPQGMQTPGVPGIPAMVQAYPGQPMSQTGTTPMSWPQTQQPGAAVAAAAPKGGGGKIALIIAIVVVVLGGGAAGLYLGGVITIGKGGESAGGALSESAGGDAAVVLAAAEMDAAKSGAPGEDEHPGKKPDAGIAQDERDAGGPAVIEEAVATTEPDAFAGEPAEPDVVALEEIAAEAPREMVTITFVTDPDRAKVLLVSEDGSEEELCQTTCQWEFPKGEDEVKVVFRRANYRDREAVFQPTEHRFVQEGLTRVQTGRRDAGAAYATIVQVSTNNTRVQTGRRDAGAADAGRPPLPPPPPRDAGVRPQPRDGGGIIIRPRDGGPRIW